MPTVKWNYFKLIMNATLYDESDGEILVFKEENILKVYDHNCSEVYNYLPYMSFNFTFSQ